MCVPALLSQIVPRYLTPAELEKKKKTERKTVANYIMMVVFHLGFVLRRPVPAHLDGAETLLDH